MRFLILPFFFALNVSAESLSVSNIFQNNTVADAAAINENFADIVNGINARLQVYVSPYTLAKNTAIGFEALHNSTNSGSNNTASGYRAMYSNDNGQSNTASGREALYNNIVGYFNTGIGREALFSNTIGNYNTAVGFKADVAADDLENATAIGSGAVVDASNKIQLGNDQVTLVAMEGRLQAGGGAFLVSAAGDISAPNMTLTANLTVGGGILADALNTSGTATIGGVLTTVGSALIGSSLTVTDSLVVGDVTYPNTHGSNGQVLGTTGSGELVWLSSGQIVASYTQELEEQVASLQEQLQSQQEELLAIVQSQQEQIAQLQKMVEHQFAVN